MATRRQPPARPPPTSTSWPAGWRRRGSRRPCQSASPMRAGRSTRTRTPSPCWPPSTPWPMSSAGRVPAPHRAPPAALSMPSVDRMAKALPLLDLGRAPVGHRSISPGQLHARRERRAGASRTGRRRRAAPRRGSHHARRGRGGDRPAVGPDRLAADGRPGSRTRSSNRIPTLVVAGRPSGAVRAIVFNVRDGHPYADPSARQAFSRCLDRDTLVADILAERGLPASTLVAPGSWAARPARLEPPTPRRHGRCSRRRATSLGSDDIYARDGERLSSEIIIRPGRAELAALMDAISKALKACGIDLRIREVPFSPDVVLPQLEWPNAFDTYLDDGQPGRRPRPSTSAGWSSDRVTTKDDPGDANYGGWRDKSTDAPADRRGSLADRGQAAFGLCRSAGAAGRPGARLAAGLRGRLRGRRPDPARRGRQDRRSVAAGLRARTCSIGAWRGPERPPTRTRDRPAIGPVEGPPGLP